MTMPLAPPGTKVIAHAYLDKRELWELNSEVGLYVGPAINYYCYLECYFWRIREIRYYNTVEFILHNSYFATIRLKDFVMQVVTDIIYILTQ